MAVFEVQIEALTGLTITSSSSPTQAELTQFLRDGVIDVTTRWLTIKPQDRELFVRESSTTASNGLDIGGASIISVLREAGADGDTDGSTAWRTCRKIPASMQSRVVDADSLHFASKYNPVYAIDSNGVINVYPIPDGTDDGFRVYYVNNDPKGDGTSDDLAYGHTTIGYFPKDKVHLVVIYAAIKALQNALPTSLTTFSLTAATPTAIVSAPSIAGGSVGDIDVASLPTAPSYVPPSVQSDSGGIELTQIVSLDAENTIDDFDGNAVEFDQWWSTVTHLIEDEEDAELAGITLQKIQAYVGAYSAQMQNNLNTFNEANAVYQAGVQRNIEQARIDMQDAQKTADLALQGAIADYQNELQRVATDAQKYQALVTAEVQQFQQILAQTSEQYQWYNLKIRDLKEEYNNAFMIAAPKQQTQE